MLNIKNLVFIVLVFVGLCLGFSGLAQPVVADRTIAVVGSEYILESEIEIQYNQLREKASAQFTDKQLHCLLLDQLLQRKMLLYRAKAVDSIKVTEAQIQLDLDRKMAFFIQQFGSESELERFYGKSIRAIKDELYESVKDQMLIEQMQSKISGTIVVAPSDVRSYYKSLSSDSLPYYNTELEIAQIVIFPKLGIEQKREARRKLEIIREDIKNGSKFEIEAIAYSMDLGTAKKGGYMEMQKAENFVPEFAAAALSLYKGSDTIVETRFGFHLLLLISRKGDMVETRHILIKPEISESSKTIAFNKLDSVKHLIDIDSISFEQAAYKFSEDQETKNRGGFLIDQKTNSSRIPVDELNVDDFFVVDKLSPGDISAPNNFVSVEQNEGYRIVYLKSKIAPHKANLDEDYPKLKLLAEERKKVELMDNWFTKYLKETYLSIDASYNDCSNLNKWNKAKTTQTGLKN
ncbi:MAG: peptidylprolyl isomerase [Bacteroidota bacterium]|nr:peptidylprolyl isomerase [Bacteroidota bacterium]